MVGHCRKIAHRLFEARQIPGALVQLQDLLVHGLHTDAKIGRTDLAQEIEVLIAI